MTATPEPLPGLLDRPSHRRIPDDLERANLTTLRKAARTWLAADGFKLPREPLVEALVKALHDDAAARRVLDALSPVDRATVAVYRRLGGTADGAVIRLDLSARGLLEVEENRVSTYYSVRRWRRNPLKGLAERWILLPDGPRADPYAFGYYGDEVSRPFERYSLHAGLASLVEPAGPAPWSVAPASGTPDAVAGRTPAEVALDLSRVFSYVAARGPIKLRKGGVLSAPALRALEKGVPFEEDSGFRLPDPHGLWIELLRYAGAIRFEGSGAVADPAAATRMFAQPDAWQAYSWARAWLGSRQWSDGLGLSEVGDLDYESRHVPTAREVLAWTLGGLAHEGDRWYDLAAFLSALDAMLGDGPRYHPYGLLAWEPEIGPKPSRSKELPVRPHRDTGGSWYANALMITLVALGLVERGRIGPAVGAPLAFRLTGIGRAVFGAPDVAPPPAPGEARFLVVQPNFDMLAYVDRADASAIGLLGRIGEGDAAGGGPIRTFRLTRTSIYRAEEGGLGHDQIVEYLRAHAQGTVPPNVLRSIADWSSRRESLTLRSGVTLLGFPTEDARDAYLKRHPGTACGARFVLATDAGERRPRPPEALESDHLEWGRRTLSLDEHGRIEAGQPLDTVQHSRLRRVAAETPGGWQLTGDSIRRAAASGLKPATVHRWLSDHLARPIPPLIARAIDAWMGKARPLELAEAVLLHVPDQETFEALSTSRRLRDLLRGSPGPGWLVVAREDRERLSALLAELGFATGPDLTLEK